MKLINICGTARSGSTMLDLIIGNDERGFSLGEVHAWFHPFRTHHFQIYCSCKSDTCPWNQLKHYKKKDFYMEAFNTLKADFIVDSSKNLSWVIENNLWARQNGVKVYNILVYKEPISFFYSFWKRGLSIDKIRENTYIKYHKRCFESGLSFIVISYNEFVADPQNELKKLCLLLGIPYFKEKVNFWEKEHHQLFGSKGTRTQVQQGGSGIRANEDFPEEYIKIIGKIKKDNQSNKEFQYILNKLSSLKDRENLNDEISIKIRKPSWYYLLKLKQRIRKQLPEKFDDES